MTGIRIEFDGLDELIDAVERVASGEFMEDVSASIAYTSVYLARRSFEEDEDPYGDAWAPWKHPPTRPHVKLMVETGSLVNSIDAIDLSSAGFTLGSFGATGWDGRAHAHFHQYGTEIMPSRKFLPDDGLPGEWLGYYVDDVVELLADYLNA